MNDLEKEIFDLENELLSSETRKSPKRINEIIADEFIEFCSSGYEYHYSKGDVFQDKTDKSELNWQISEFKIKSISEECILATYKVVKNNEINEDKKYTLRSSIWKCFDGKWKMIFHQVTLCEKFK